MNRHLTLNILQSVNAMENVFYINYVILVFFNKYAHYSIVLTFKSQSFEFTLSIKLFIVLRILITLITNWILCIIIISFISHIFSRCICIRDNRTKFQIFQEQFN